MSDSNVSLQSSRFICAMSVAGVLFVATLCHGQKISFREQVQPLIANKCLACHGPDENAREAGLRLDAEEHAKDYAIEPGNADESELIARIESDDPDLVMPPPGHGTPLSAAEKKLLRDWINQGAPWQGHWAFEPINQPPVPADQDGWCKSPIDQFVLKRMKAAGLERSAPADDSTIIRRLYLDLTGLPPTPAQVKQFVNDNSVDRFEKAVDQLLASPHYGEHMAAAWLDIARFADTNGYQNDFVRSMWVWRDWIIQAYNQNMPYDQFIIEQIAGDMLPDPTTSQLIASGFNRNNPSVTEGGAIDEEWRIENGVDRIETTAAAFLGLTVGCARCHDHKYDPVSQKEFYELFAFFNNIDEKGVYTERRGNAPPLINTPTKEQINALQDLEEQIEALNQKIAAHDQNHALDRLREWRVAVGDSQGVPRPFWSTGDLESKTKEWSPAGEVLNFDGKANASAQSDTEPNIQFERNTPFSWICWVHGESRGAIFGKMDESQDYRGLDTLILGDGRLKIHFISTWNTNAIAVLSKDPIPAKWNHLAVTYSGNSKASGFKIYLNGRPIATTTEFDRLKDTTLTKVPFRIGQRSESSYLRGKLSRFRLFNSVLSEEHVESILKQDVVRHLDRVENSSLDQGAGDAATSFLQQSDDLLVAKTELMGRRKKLIKSQQTTMIMKERSGEYRPTWKLNRGQYDQPMKDVDLWPGIPAVLPQLTENQPKNRLGLARWLVDDRNPLVARVIVNRAWQKFFGRGLVDSPDNFGIQGNPPSHPELLDWLADDFRSNGWDLKRLHRTIVLSATYQQASDLTPNKLKLDRENKWLSRGPRYRLSAEQIRDGALLVSNLLNPEVGGPSVFPYQPDGLWEELAGGANNGPYKQSIGKDLYRRSLYTYRKRTVPHPTTSTFDAPSWEKCQIKRASTNTPLQSLALLNDTTYVEAAKKFAERILDEGGQTLDERIHFAVLAATSRPPSDVEKKTLKGSYQHYLEYYLEHLDEAKELLTAGESAIETSNDAELASMTTVALVILNLDQTITKE